MIRRAAQALCISLALTLAAPVPGVITLDSYTFDKIIGSKPTLVKFDKAYNYGDKQEAFRQAALTVGQAGAKAGVLVAEVQLTDYNKENREIAERYGVKMDALPHFIMFGKFKKTESNGKKKKKMKAPSSLLGDVTQQSILSHILKEGGVWVGLQGTLQDMDVLAFSFMAGTPPVLEGDGGSSGSAAKVEVVKQGEAVKSGTADQKAVLKEAKAAMKKYEAAGNADGASEDAKDDHASAVFYVKMMKKVISDGAGFVQKEKDRLTRMSQSRVSEAKILQFKRKINICPSFLVQAVEEAAAAAAAAAKAGAAEEDLPAADSAADL